MARSKPGDYYTDFVARVLSLLEPDCKVRVGEWIDGPDGRRDMDVEVRGSLDGRSHLCLVECKDWDRRVGIQVVDALDSKRTDVRADRAIIYSNSGFTAPAIRKAKRVGIELASAVCEHDPAIRPRLVTRHVARAVVIRDFVVRLMVIEPARPPTPFGVHDIFFDGLPLQNWVHEHSAMALPGDADTGRIELEYRFRDPAVFQVRGEPVRVAGFRLVLSYDGKWFYQDGPVDLSVGAYDVVQGAVLVPPHQSIAFPFKTAAWQPLPDGDPVPGPIDPKKKGLQMRLKVFDATPAHERLGVPEVDRLIASTTIVTVENVPWSWDVIPR
jgi:hypothetical protein